MAHVDWEDSLYFGLDPPGTSGVWQGLGRVCVVGKDRVGLTDAGSGGGDLSH